MVRSILFLLIFSWQLLLANVEIPTLTRRVTDQTNTLSQAELEFLETTLRNYEDTTSNQIVVLMISTLNDYPIEEYCFQVAEKNKIGQKGKDNGILLFIAKDDREVRIEVGYGLEGVVTDAISGTIIRNIIVPNFRENNYYKGIKESIDAM
ncbi:MAG: TPM domain-containing protein, partial [Ignavibacteria bacterium]|nr:TPM domain-containing protein [Ignavibacteria bacterium]